MRFTYRIFTVVKDEYYTNVWHITKTSGDRIYYPDGSSCECCTISADSDVEVMNFIDRVFFGGH